MNVLYRTIAVLLLLLSSLLLLLCNDRAIVVKTLHRYYTVVMID